MGKKQRSFKTIVSRTFELDSFTEIGRIGVVLIFLFFFRNNINQ